MIRSIAFVASFALVYAAQAWIPYRREWRLGTRSWLQNLPLAGMNTIILGAICGACLCTVSRYAAERRFGLFHFLEIPASLSAAATLVVQDFAL